MPFSPFRRFFHSFRTREYLDNEVLATRSDDLGCYEVVYWCEGFEVYFRPFKKRYGYLLGRFDDLAKALNVMKSSNSLKSIHYKEL